MTPSVEPLENLLALKRLERPGEGYWQDFLKEFHQRQREQAVKRSGVAGMISRSVAWFVEVGPAKWSYAAGLAYATVTVAFLLSPNEVRMERAPISPVIHVAPPQFEQLNQLDLSPSSQGSAGEQVF